MTKEQQALKLWQEFFELEFDPFLPLEDGKEWCMFCGEEYGKHKDGCVWVCAKELVQGPQFEGYCIRCREKRVIEDAVVNKTLKGRPVVRGTCPECGLKITRFLSAKQAGK